MRRLISVTCVCLMSAVPTFAQQAANDPSAAQTSTEQPPPGAAGGPLQAGAEWIRLFTDDTRNGVYAQLGGLPPGSGIAAGPGYRQRLFDGRVIVDGSAAASSSRGTLAQATVEVPRLAGDHLSVGGQVKRQDFTRLGYFGVGPDSLESDGTAYRLENMDYLAFANVKPRAGLIVGGRIGYSPSVTIERPRAANDPAAQDLFTTVTAPGLGNTPAFLHGAAYSFVAAADVDAEHSGVAGVNSESDPVRRLQVTEIQIAESRRHLAGVVEESAIERAEYPPAIFGIEQQKVSIAEPVVLVPTQRAAASQRRQQVEGNDAVLRCVGCGDAAV